MRKKNLLASVAATAICIASIVPALAADPQTLPGPTDGTKGDATVPVTCEISSGYTVKLPAAVSLAKNTMGSSATKDDYAAGYVVSVTGNIASGEFVNVTPTNIADFKLKDASGAREVTPSVFAKGVSWSAEELGDGEQAVNKGSMIEAKIPYAGNYSGNLSYEFGIASEAATNAFVLPSAGTATGTSVDNDGNLLMTATTGGQTAGGNSAMGG